MKMMMAIIQRGQADEVMQALIEAGFSVTFMESRGGVLRQSQQTLFIAVQDKDVKSVMQIIRAHCQHEVEIDTESRQIPIARHQPRIKARIGNSIIFIWELENIEIWLPDNKPKVA